MSIKGFELVVRAVVRDGARVLLAHPARSSWYFLPGGHVELGESAPAALRRERREELGVVGVRVGDLVAVTETRYSDARGGHHELNLVYEVATTDVRDDSQESHIGFHWFHQRGLAELEIRPAAVARLLREGLSGPRLRLLSEGFEPD